MLKIEVNFWWKLFMIVSHGLIQAKQNGIEVVGRYQLYNYTLNSVSNKTKQDIDAILQVRLSTIDFAYIAF